MWTFLLMMSSLLPARLQLENINSHKSQSLVYNDVATHQIVGGHSIIIIIIITSSLNHRYYFVKVRNNHKIHHKNI